MKGFYKDGDVALGFIKADSERVFIGGGGGSGRGIPVENIES